MAFYDSVRGWFGRWGALGERVGQQHPVPSTALVSDTANIGPDGALQISAVWACIERRATVIASLPFFAYTNRGNGQKELARDTRLYQLLHDSPNSRMTPFEFWRAMLMNHDLRGNAYARIDRDERTGEAMALWPMPADQVRAIMLEDGTMVYEYRLESDVAMLAAESVLHLKNLGNGTIGLAKLEFMRATTDEAAKAQTSASRMFGNGGKPTGILMVDSVLKKEQREAINDRFKEMAQGNTSRLYVLQANMKYQQLSLSPEDMQLLETRRFTVEEICRWFDVPPVLVHHSNVTTWGSGVEQIISGFHKFTIRPMLVNIEQAVRKGVMTPKQRAGMSIEFSFDALLRGDPASRAAFYSTGLQNGYMTRNEVRQLENLPRDSSAGADMLTAQSNLLPLDKLGAAQPAPAEPVASKSLQLMLSQQDNQRQEQRHMETLAALRSTPTSQPVDLAGAVIHLTRNENPIAPIVQVTNMVQPTAVEVTVTNDVQPAAVEVMANFEAVVQPATVTLNMPPRRTEGTITRDEAGNIIKTVTVEKDA